jgi:hypothetical protein
MDDQETLEQLSTEITAAINASKNHTENRISTLACLSVAASLIAGIECNECRKLTGKWAKRAFRMFADGAVQHPHIGDFAKGDQGHLH